MSIDTCANCRDFVDTDIDCEAYFLNDKQNDFALCESCRENFTDDMEADEGDLVEFIGRDSFGLTRGTGVVMRLYKNGKADVMMDGYKYRTAAYTVLQRAG